jgi:hypothetical protein
MGYDVALALLEEAALLLDEGRAAEVKALAVELARAFEDQGVHREARAALELFKRRRSARRPRPSSPGASSSSSSGPGTTRASGSAMSHPRGNPTGPMPQPVVEPMRLGLRAAGSVGVGSAALVGGRCGPDGGEQLPERLQQGIARGWRRGGTG